MLPDPEIVSCTLLLSSLYPVIEVKGQWIFKLSFATFCLFLLSCNSKSLTSNTLQKKKEIEDINILQPTIKNYLEILFKVSRFRLTRKDVDHILVSVVITLNYFEKVVLKTVLVNSTMLKVIMGKDGFALD